MIDETAERAKFEADAARKGYDRMWMRRSAEKYPDEHLESEWQGWLAAKRDSEKEK